MKHLFRLGTTLRDQARTRPVTGMVSEHIELPAPERAGGMPIMEAFAKRRTTRRFAADLLDDTILSNLLWAANGINREPDGGRTAPSVLALHEIDIYAVLARGLYRYDPRRHRLDLAIASDLRGLTGYQDFVGDAPLDLVYVADLARMHDITPSQREPFASASAGAIAQNVYLFCAAAGLAVAARGWLNRSALSVEMRLPRDSVPVLAQTVGHFDSSDSADDAG
ncbi:MULTISPECIES: SagB/ThcOx family dehydrogenase [Paraburkholderia]|uniref:SagB/ThcOx family dehydrogenase n=1 Tax=Paraburkholderia podalyriae TaxID=1938811 RepID=A0ABR7PXU9_9BURK|nr:SagB/ThcOx family dehydrogenase [Paraburkholderia podalyriae]MBC8751093.1 SagB/ThcOx family dehydrogenase [Paraburkholderia podalyriae]